MKNKILIVLTNTAQYGADTEATGLWLAEATEFVEEVLKAGYQVDYVSPQGGEVPLDPRSLKKIYTKSSDLAILQSDDFQKRALTSSLAPDQIKSEDYVAIYYTGGHGVVWDFPHNDALQIIATDIYAQGGYICSVCHGVAGLLNLKDKQGAYLIKDKQITGFTQLEEILSGKHRKVPFSTEAEAKRRGCQFKKRLPFTSFVVQDGRFITGQNPMSGRAVALQLLQALRK